MSKAPGQVCFAGAVVTPAEFQIALEARRKAKLEKLNAAPDRPLTDDEVRARIEFLKADNARMRGVIARREQATDGVEFCCAPGFTVDPVSLKIHQAALIYQRSHGVPYLDAVRRIENTLLGNRNSRP